METEDKGTTPRITKIERPKNLKRVEQGKRLAAISREAKEKKARERNEAKEAAEKVETDHGEGFSGNTALIATIAVVVVAGGVYYDRQKSESNTHARQSDAPGTQRNDSPPKPRKPAEARTPATPDSQTNAKFDSFDDN